MNVTKVLTKDYENKTLSQSGKNKANSKPNKANLQNAQMNVTNFLTKDYENIANWTLGENEPKTNPTCRGVASGEAGSNPILARLAVWQGLPAISVADSNVTLQKWGITRR